MKSQIGRWNALLLTTHWFFGSKYNFINCIHCYLRVGWLIHCFLKDPCSSFLPLPVAPDPDPVWRTVTGVMPFSDGPVDPHSLNTTQGHSSFLRVVLAKTLQSMNTYLPYMPGISFCLRVDQYQGFSTFFFPLREHVASIFRFFSSLARLSHFNPSSCETEWKEGRKKDGSVSEEAHGSWRSLITVMTERNGRWKTCETERSRHGRDLSAEMR